MASVHGNQSILAKATETNPSHICVYVNGFSHCRSPQHCLPAGDRHLRGWCTPVGSLLFFATHTLASHMHLTCLYVMDACVEQYMFGDIQLLHSLGVGTQYLQQHLSPPMCCLHPCIIEVHFTIDLVATSP